MKVTQSHRAAATTFHLFLTALALLLPTCQGTPLVPDQPKPTTATASTSPLSKRAMTMVCTGNLPATNRNNYPTGLWAGHYANLQAYCENPVMGPNCACWPVRDHTHVVVCIGRDVNARFMNVGATEVCRSVCACHDLPDRVPPEVERAGLLRLGLERAGLWPVAGTGARGGAG